MKPTRLYLNSLTIARGLAAWLVVTFHIVGSIKWMPWPIMRIVNHGYLAVDFFFLLSGFVIWMTAHKELETDRLNAILPFFRRRFARMYPLYAVMLTLTVIFVIILEVTGRDSSGYPWRELPLHITMTQNWGFTHKLSWNHPAWSLSTEMASYLLFPVLVLCLPISKMPRWLLLACIALLIITLAACFHSLGINTLGNKIPEYGLIRCLSQFTIGALLCAFWLRSDHMSNIMAIIPPALIASIALIILFLDINSQIWAFPIFGSAAILTLAEISRRFPPTAPLPLLHRFFIYLGDTSYAVYLSHFMLFIWFKIAFVSDVRNISLPLILLYYAMTFATSVLLYHYVEIPGRRRFNPPRPTPTSSS